MKKASNVELLTVVIRVGVGGKCVVLVTGDVAAVKSALTSGEAAVGKDSKIVSSVVIPAPSENMIDAL
jgi:microcompartment protein CcmL/EutN